METRQIIICRGIQGSGKSTWAKQWCHEDPEHRIRFNNDDIRNMLGDYWVPSRESMVTSMYTVFIANAMIKGYNIVIDNMNLSSKTVAGIEKTIQSFNKEQSFNWKYKVEYKDFFIPLEECIRRDAMRPNPIGEAIIRQTFKRYRDLITSEEIAKIRANKAPRIKGASPAIIVDIDGTIALRVDDRPWFGPGAAAGMLNDEPIEGTCFAVHHMHDKCKIIIVTGREASDEVMGATFQWLDDNGIMYDEIYFRPVKDYSKAADCKKKIYEEHIKGKYNVLFVLEDNNQCVQMWREEGLTCLQPNEGKF